MAEIVQRACAGTMESSDVYEEGLVIRTDPAAGADVKEGQTVYIYVSSGPAVVTAPMPESPTSAIP